MSLELHAEPACVESMVHEVYCTMPDAWRKTRRRCHSQDRHASNLTSVGRSPPQSCSSKQPNNRTAHRKYSEVLIWTRWKSEARAARPSEHIRNPCLQARATGARADVDLTNTIVTTLVSDGSASRGEQRISEVDCANADGYSMPDTSRHPGTPHGGDPQTTPILTTSYCQDPAVQIRKVR